MYDNREKERAKRKKTKKPSSAGYHRCLDISMTFFIHPQQKSFIYIAQEFQHDFQNSSDQDKIVKSSCDRENKVIKSDPHMQSASTWQTLTLRDLLICASRWTRSMFLVLRPSCTAFFGSAYLQYIRR